MLKCGQKNNHNYTFGHKENGIKIASVKCPNCGEKNDSISKYCSQCGYDLKK